MAGIIVSKPLGQVSGGFRLSLVKYCKTIPVVFAALYQKKNHVNIYILTIRNTKHAIIPEFVG